MNVRFEAASNEFWCGDCGTQITLEQHRRKAPRCDQCEFEHVAARLRAQLNAWNGTGDPRGGA